MSLSSKYHCTFRTLRIISLLFLAVSYRAGAQGAAYDGYTLFNPNNSRTTYLVDMDGNTVHTWSHTRNGGYAVYLLENGHLLRPASTSTPSIRGAASAGLIQEVDWDGKVVWQFDYAGATKVTHHDIEPMPNGNVLLIAWEVKSTAEAAAAGRVNAREMWPDHIVEVKPEGSNGGTIVWEWHAWDHLVQDADPSKANYGVVAEHPELIDVNLGGSTGGPGGGDWLHINGISYNPISDQIVISSHFMNEIYVIDHSTTTQEAAGHTGGRHGKGGDILYRWGQARNYGRTGGDVFDVVHCSYWIPEGCPGAGNLLVFNNNARSRASIVTELTPPVDQDGNYVLSPGQAFGPSAPTWTYANGSVFYSNHLGGNQRLPNGNTFITEATSGYLFEVDATGKEVWSYDFHQEIARALRYSRDYPGVSALLGTAVEESLPASSELRTWNAPNPFAGQTVISLLSADSSPAEIHICNALGQRVRTLRAEAATSGVRQVTWDGRGEAGNALPSGMYTYVVLSSTAAETGRMLLLPY
jgi:hypothetical protein